MSASFPAVWDCLPLSHSGKVWYLLKVNIKTLYHIFPYNNSALEDVENDWGEGRAVAVRKKMVQYIWRIFNKYHTSKFDMSGHPIVTDVFHVLEKTGDMPKKYK